LHFLFFFPHFFCFHFHFILFFVLRHNFLGCPAKINKQNEKQKKIGQPPLAAREQHMLQEALEGSGEIPLIVIVSVSVCGTILFLLNIVLISCFVHKKRKREKQQQQQSKGPGSSEGRSS
jgi:hypothetical protein